MIRPLIKTHIPMLIHSCLSFFVKFLPARFIFFLFHLYPETLNTWMLYRPRPSSDRIEAWITISMHKVHSLHSLVRIYTLHACSYHMTPLLRRPTQSTGMHLPLGSIWRIRYFWDHDYIRTIINVGVWCCFLIFVPSQGLAFAAKHTYCHVLIIDN